MADATTSFGFAEVRAADKPRRVRAVFDSIASRYDLMNDLMSAGAHRLWKDAAAVRLNPQPGEIVVDCAGGTGDMARRLERLARAARHRRGGAEAQIVIVDPSVAMLDAARARENGGAILATGAEAERLPLRSGSVDGFMISFGLRNTTDPKAALGEARRVLRPGGRFVCLEFSRPAASMLRRAYDAYSFAVIPRLGGWVAGNAAAYRYLVESIRRFPNQEGLATLMREAGFARVTFTNLSGGICALHQGWVV